MGKFLFIATFFLITSISFAGSIRITMQGSVGKLINQYYDYPGPIQHGERLNEIRKLNPHIKDFYNLYVGQILFLQPKKLKKRYIRKSVRVIKPVSVQNFINQYYDHPGPTELKKKLYEIKLFNPHIKDFDNLYDGQLVVLYVEKTPEVKKVQIVEKEKKAKDKLKKYYEVSLEYGIEYLFTKQESIRGVLETNGWVENLLNLGFSAGFNDFGVDARVQTAYLDWETKGGLSAGEFRIWRTYLGAKWKLLALRFEYNDEPLFRLTSLTTVEGTYQTTGWLLLGISELNTYRPDRTSFWKYSLLVGIPVFTKSRDLDETLENKMGLKINLDASYNGKIVKWANSELLWSIFLGLYYQNQEFGNTWQAYSGTNDLEILKTDLIGRIIYSF